jgi:hypothetical protein
MITPAGRRCGGAREGAGYVPESVRKPEETRMSDNTQDLNFLQGVKVVDFTQFDPMTIPGTSTSSTSTRSHWRSI